MVLLLVAGFLLLSAWVAWVLFILHIPEVKTISLVLLVDQAEDYLDPFLRIVCYLFGQNRRLRLLEIWVLSRHEAPESQRIVHRLQRRYPVFRFRAPSGPPVDNLPLQGELRWQLDLIDQLTPLKALDQLLDLLRGPMGPGSKDLVYLGKQ